MKNKKVKFAVDGMLGRVAKWLRMLGFDTIYDTKKSSELLYKEALREERIFITRNRKLKEQNDVIFISSDNPLEQFREISKTVPIKEKRTPFTRCILCNRELKPIEKEKIKERVPFYTYENFNEFYECPSCRRIYWKGTHYHSMLKRVEELFDNKN